MFIYQNVDRGPTEDMTEEEFNACAHRYGRILEKSTRVNLHGVHIIL